MNEDVLKCDDKVMSELLDREELNCVIDKIREFKKGV